MSFRYVLVEEKDRRDFEKQVNYYGAKGYKAIRFHSRPEYYAVLMEKFNGRRGGENRR